MARLIVPQVAVRALQRAKSSGSGFPGTAFSETTIQIFASGRSPMCASRSA